MGQGALTRLNEAAASDPQLIACIWVGEQKLAKNLFYLPKCPGNIQLPDQVNSDCNGRTNPAPKMH